MKRLPFHILCVMVPALLCTVGALSQSYYFTGAFFDNKSQPLANVNIRLHYNQVPFMAGRNGEYGIPSFYASDSAICYIEGFDTLRVLLKHGVLQKHVLQMQPSYAEKLIKASRLSSLTKLPPEYLLNKVDAYTGSGESYHRLAQNQWHKTAIAPFTGFVPNSNKSSYANLRRFVRQQTQVPPNAVRVEELWNYFNLNTIGTLPAHETFHLHNITTDCPWNPGNKLVIINAVARRINIDSLPPVNMVFLIDNSGSMEEANRLPLLKSGFKKMVEFMRPQDRVGIVTYGGAAGIYLKPTFGNEKEKIMQALDSIEAGGSTPGSNGIQLAYELVTTNAFSNGINKVILATDGDFNIGVSEESDLEVLINRYRTTGVTLNCVGVGMGNYKDSKIEVLARMGNGNFAYLDSDEEAEKALVMQLGESSITVAKDVTIQFGFDQQTVKEYRLVGYENRMEALQVVPQQLIGSEVSSGQCIIGMAEIVPSDSSQLNTGTSGFFEMQYKWPDKDSTLRQVQEFNNQVIPLQQADSTVKMAVTLAWLARELKSNKQTGQFNFEPIEKLAQQCGSAANTEVASLTALLANIRKIYEPVTETKKGRKQKQKNRDNN